MQYMKLMGGYDFPGSFVVPLCEPLEKINNIIIPQKLECRHLVSFCLSTASMMILTKRKQLSYGMDSRALGNSEVPLIYIRVNF